MAGSPIGELPYSKLRRYTRVQADTPVGVLLGSRYRVHSAMEIGEGGLLFTSSRAYVSGSLIELSILLPNERVLNVSGEVVYEFRQRETYHIGVRFLDPSESVQATIRLFIQKEKRR
jgi:hypothetical protein